MIEPISIDGIHFEVDDDLKKYVIKKIAKLDRYAPRRARNGLHAEVKLKETHGKGKKQCTCEVMLHIPGDDIIVSETTVNMYAAIDIVETRLKNQLKKYKETHGHLAIHQRVLSRLKRRTPEPTV